MFKDFTPTLTFEIKTSKDLFNNLLTEYRDFDKQHLNPRYAMNTAINSWHLTDWTYQEFYINDIKFQDSFELDKNGCKKFYSGLHKYQMYLISICPELKYMRLITNGVKHCILRDKRNNVKTFTHKGDYSTDYSRKDYNVNRFLIQIDDDEKIDYEKTLLITINFWKEYLDNEYSKRNL